MPLKHGNALTANISFVLLKWWALNKSIMGFKCSNVTSLLSFFFFKSFVSSYARVQPLPLLLSSLVCVCFVCLCRVLAPSIDPQEAPGCNHPLPTITGRLRSCGQTTSPKLKRGVKDHHHLFCCSTQTHRERDVDDLNSTDRYRAITT